MFSSKVMLILVVALFAVAYAAEEAVREKKQAYFGYPGAYSAYSAYPYSAYPYSAYSGAYPYAYSGYSGYPYYY